MYRLAWHLTRTEKSQNYEKITRINSCHNTFSAGFVFSLLQIGLAVGDIEAVQRNARLKRLAMQVLRRYTKWTRKKFSPWSSKVPTSAGRSARVSAGGDARRAGAEAAEAAARLRGPVRVQSVPQLPPQPLHLGTCCLTGIPPLK